MRLCASLSMHECDFKEVPIDASVRLINVIDIIAYTEFLTDLQDGVRIYIEVVKRFDNVVRIDTYIRIYRGLHGHC